MIFIDANLYIDFKIGKKLEVFSSIEDGHHLALSSVVALELFAGAKSKRSKKNVDLLWDRFDKIGRIVSPSVQAYRKAGRVIERMTDHRKDVMSDVLIALTVREHGAELWTSDRDFERIQKVVDFKLRVC